jgi:uncharacterized protein DUF6941
LAEESPELSQVVPLLVAALVCDVAVADPSTWKKNLIGIFDRIFVGQFPTQRPTSLYIKLTDAEGLYRFQVRYVQADSGLQLGLGEGEFQVTDRRASLDLHMAFPALPLPTEGRYEFQVWANSIFLGSTFIDAVQRP